MQKGETQLQAAEAPPAVVPFQNYFSLNCPAAGAALLGGIKSDPYINRARLARAAIAGSNTMCLLLSITSAHQQADRQHNSAEVNLELQQQQLQQEEVQPEAVNRHSTLLKVVLEVLLLLSDVLLPVQLGLSFRTCIVLLGVGQRTARGSCLC